MVLCQQRSHQTCWGLGRKWAAGRAHVCCSDMECPEASGMVCTVLSRLDSTQGQAQAQDGGLGLRDTAVVVPRNHPLTPFLFGGARH